MPASVDLNTVVDLDRPARALRALRVACAVLALLAFAAVAVMVGQELHAPTGRTTVNAVLILAVIAVFVVTPPTWFAINALRPIFLLPIIALFAWSAVGYHDYLRRAGASYSAGTISEFLIAFLPLGVMLWAAARGLRLTAAERSITRAIDRGAGYFTILRFAFGVWPGLRRSRVQAIVSSTLLYASQIFQGLSMVLIGAILVLTPGDVAQIVRTPDAYDGASILARVYDLGSLVFLAMLGAVALLLIGAGLRNLGRWASRQSFEKQVGRDERAPILFLRAFKDDQATLPQGNFLLRLLRAELGRRRLDHILVEEFSRFGPVVALGLPGQRMRPFGAARIYVEHADWQARVRDLAGKSGHIVLVADAGAGVEWEIDTMLGPALRAKTLFLATQRVGDLRTCDRLRPLLETGGGSTRIIAMYRSHNERTMVLHAARPTPEGYIVALQAFFRRDQSRAA